MDTTRWMFCQTQLDEAARRYLEEGSKLLYADRQADIDGARRLLLSDAFKKCRQDPAPPAPPQRTVLDVRGPALPTAGLALGKTTEST